MFKKSEFNEFRTENHSGTQEEIRNFVEVRYAASPSSLGKMKELSVSDNLFRQAVFMTDRDEKFTSGDRKDYVSQLANNLNRIGMDEATAERMINSEYTTPDLSSEISSMIKSAYAQTDEHGMVNRRVAVARPARTAMTAMVAEPPALKTPVIPGSVFDHLPGLLRECTRVFDVPRERDVVLTTSLSILSGCFNGVSGQYDGRSFRPNIYSFIIAPPASGKGVMNFSKRLAKNVDDSIKEGYESFSGGNKPRTHFVPADSSSAAVKRMLTMNNGKGTICETEADTLTNTLMQEWGTYDDLLRKAFQHETVSFSRVVNTRDQSDDVSLADINNPCLSVALSGTPGQVSRLLTSTENGLFSRFLFYTYRLDGKVRFKDVFAKRAEVTLDAHFDKLAGAVLEYYQKAEKVGEVTFDLTGSQQEEFKGQFNERLQDLSEKYGEETHGIVFRLGLITFRLAMLLTILRSMENDSLSEHIICSDEDFGSAMILSKIYLEHSMAVFRTLPESNSKSVNRNAMALLNRLPSEFKYSDAVEIGTSSGFGERSISTYLKEMVANNYLGQPKQNGTYFKA